MICSGVDQSVPLEVLFATYGDARDPELSMDVTDRCIALVGSFSASDRIAFRPETPAHLLFGGDPLPGRPKQLKMRYRIGGTHGALGTYSNDPPIRLSDDSCCCCCSSYLSLSTPPCMTGSQR